MSGPMLLGIVIAAGVNASAAPVCPPQNQLDATTRNAQAALMRAMNQGDTASALAVINAGFDVNARDTSCRTPLLWAAQWGRLEVVQALAKAGADVNAKDQQGWTAVALAFEFAHFYVAEALINAGADRSQLPRDLNAKRSSGFSPLTEALRNKDMNSVRALIRLGANPNSLDESGRTPLAWAAMAGDLETVRGLLAAGAQPDAHDKPGWTPLILAASMGRNAVVRALVAAGADANFAGPSSWNALMQASRRGDLESVLALIPATNINYRDQQGISALMLARWGCHTPVVHALTGAGAVVGPQEWERVPQFDDFPVHRMYKGRVASVDLTSNPRAREYRTRIREGARKGPNFAGHYSVVSWGCGSNCQSFAIVDAVTGRVYDGFGAERGAEFKVNSNLLIADPAYPSAAPDDPVGTLPVRYLVWKDKSFKLIYEQSCSQE